MICRALYNRRSYVKECSKVKVTDLYENLFGG